MACGDGLADGVGGEFSFALRGDAAGKFQGFAKDAQAAVGVADLEQLLFEIRRAGGEVLLDNRAEVIPFKFPRQLHGHADAADHLLVHILAFCDALIETAGAEQGEAAAGAVVDVAEDFQERGI